MRVLITYTSYPCSDNDWRVRFMHDMVHSLARLSTLHLRAWGPPGPMPANTIYTASPEDSQWMADMLEKGGVAHLIRSKSPRGLVSAAKLSLLMRQAYIKNQDVDLYHINWLQGALALPHNRIPCLISVLGTDLKLLKLPGMKSILRRIFKKHRCILAPNADWMVPVLAEHFNDVVLKIQTVPFGIEQRWFAIQRKVDYNSTRNWVSVIRVTRKKIGSLFEWGDKIFKGKDELHLYGPNPENIIMPPWVHYHGPAAPEHLLKDVYPEAYGYISLSQHDEGRPQAILEAMASGLPIIASDIEAHRNLLKNTKGGLLVNSAESLTEAIETLDDRDVHTRSCKAAKEFILHEHGTWDACAKRYENMYKILTEQNL